MGSPLGPTLANIFMSFHEKNWLNNCPPSFQPKLYRCYVDDMFVLFSSPDHIKHFVDYLNRQHPNIRFTYETEQKDEHSFLDVKVRRQDNCFTTTVYRKPTFSGVFTNFISYIPETYKIGLIFTLLFRCYALTSSFCNFHKEVTFTRNGYPLKIIDRCIKQFLDKKIPQ